MKTVSTLGVMLLGLAAATAQTLSNYQSTITAQSPSAYYKLDGTYDDAVGGTALQPNGVGVAFARDAYRNVSNAFSFLNGDNALLQFTDVIPGGDTVTNGAAAGVGSISLLFRSLDFLTTNGQRYVFFQGTTTSNGNALSLFFENATSGSDPLSLKLRVGNVTTAILLSNAVAFNRWYYFAMTYDEARDTGEVVWYLGTAGGALNSGTIDMGNDAVVGENSLLHIGNQTNLTAGFRSPGRGRIDEFAVWTNELSAIQISNQFSKLPALPPGDATYQQVVSAELPTYYFKLDNSFVDSVGGSLMLSTNGSGGSFVSDLLGNANAAYSFADTNDALYIMSDLINGGGPAVDTTADKVGSISLLFRMLSDTNNEGQRFIFSAPASSVNGNQLTLFLESTTTANGNPNSLKLRVGNTTKGNVGATDPVPLAQPEEIVPNAWYYFAMTYDESRNTPEVFIYFGRVGGSLTNTSFNPANNSVVGDNGTLWIGNRDTLTSGFRNPGQGAVDEFAIWHDELSVAEVIAQFNAATNSPVVGGPAPALSITEAGSDVLISWPANTDPAYALESATNLTTSSWSAAGAPSVVGTNNVVTNAISGNERYFRLHKP